LNDRADDDKEAADGDAVSSTEEIEEIRGDGKDSKTTPAFVSLSVCQFVSDYRI